MDAGKPMGPSRAVRRFLLHAAFAGGAVGGAYAVLGLLGHGVRMLPSVAVVVLVLIGRPLTLLRGRTLLRAGEIVAVRPPIRRVVVPVSQAGLVERRRGLLLEWPVLGLRDGRMVALAAPTRLWFRADPEFDRGLAALCAHVREHTVIEMRPQWSVFRLVAGPLVTGLAFGLVLVEPPWASDLWPLRSHARRLPDACRLFDARARALLPGARIDRPFGDDAVPHAERHTCLWAATGLAADRTTLVDVGRLSVELELEHGVGRTSDAAEAHREFVRETLIGPGEFETRLTHLGDEAELIDLSPRSDRTRIAVAVRKANVEEKIDLMYRDRSRAREAAEAAKALARLGLARIHFDRK